MEEEELDDTEGCTIPTCPYCYGYECEHILLDYDITFMEYLYGYLLKDQTQIYELEESIFELIRSESKPELSDPYLKEIWDYYVSDIKVR